MARNHGIVLRLGLFQRIRQDRARVVIVVVVVVVVSMFWSRLSARQPKKLNLARRQKLVVPGQGKVARVWKVCKKFKAENFYQMLGKWDTKLSLLT